MATMDDGLKALQTLVGTGASFHDGQWAAIEALVEQRKRVLCVQRTGWGKSAVYFVATQLLRAQGYGPTLIVSPLIALMRNQIERAQAGGVRAERIDSTGDDDAWTSIEQRINANDIDVLLVSPERFANDWFAKRIMPKLIAHIGLFVIDEAHCISDWGHDFRPNYRRIIHILNTLPDHTPVLCTTATANDRVVDDIIAQLGDDLFVQRGPLARHSLTLDVVRLPTQAERLAWLAQAIPAIDGCGIVYTLTIDDARQVAEWLRQQGIDALSYTGADEDGERVAAEARLIANDVKVVVATSALGMGYDKPDLAFVIHYQAPGSAVHYYQQVGRAGRALETAHGILLDGDEDQSIISWFIDTAFPDQDQAEAVVALLENRNDWVSGREIETEINIRRSRLHNMMVNLEVDGAIERDRTKYRRTEQPWTFPRERVDAITALRRAEQQRMLDYRRGDGCLMQHLRNELDDLEAPTCGKCSHCTGAHVFDVTIDRELARSARDYLRQRPYFIDPRRQWSDGKRIGAEFRCEQGRALGRQGDGNWGDGHWDEVAWNPNHANDPGAKQLSLHERVEPLAIALAELVKVWQPMPAPTWLTYIPSTSNPHFAVVVAERIAALLGIALHPVIERGIDRPPQSAMENSVQQHRNVAGAFDVIGDIPSGPVILFDDSINSKWTMTVVAALLREAGSGPVFPLVVGVAGTDA